MQLTRLTTQPRPGVNIAGTWKLDPALSTDTRAALQHLIAPPHREARPASSGPGPEIPVDISLQRSVLRGGDYLKIEQKPSEIIISNSYTTNSYVPGERDVVSVPSGVADQRSGWKKNEYWIEIRPEVGPGVTERFRRSDDGKRLIETIDVASEGRVRSLHVRRVYDPARAVPTFVPEGD